jgi:hypothetical protein
MLFPAFDAVEWTIAVGLGVTVVLAASALHYVSSGPWRFYTYFDVVEESNVVYVLVVGVGLEVNKEERERFFSEPVAYVYYVPDLVTLGLKFGCYILGRYGGVNVPDDNSICAILLELVGVEDYLVLPEMGD